MTDLDTEAVRRAAKGMFKKYGAALAMEYAYGYAKGVYFEQHAHGRRYWMAVWEEIQKLYEQEKGR